METHPAQFITFAHALLTALKNKQNQKLKSVIQASNSLPPSWHWHVASVPYPCLRHAPQLCP